MRMKVILVAALFLLGGMPTLTAQTVRAQPPGVLPFGTLMSPDLVDWFNQVAGPEDIATVKAGEVDLLPRITAGKRQVVVASVAEAEQLVPTIADQCEIIGYDLEHWPQTPDDEQADPVGAVQRLRELADKYGLEVALGPDRRFSESHGVQMAPYADRYIIQLQRAQDDPEVMLDFALPLIQDLRQANPNLKISVVFYAEDNVEQILHLVDLLRDEIDAVSVLSTSTTTQSVKMFVEALRQAEAEALVPPAATATPSTPPEQTATPTAAPSPTTPSTIAPTPTPPPTAAPLPTPTQPATECTWPTGIVLTGGGLTALLAHRRRRGSGSHSSHPRRRGQ